MSLPRTISLCQKGDSREQLSQHPPDVASTSPWCACVEPDGTLELFPGDRQAVLLRLLEDPYGSGRRCHIISGELVNVRCRTRSARAEKPHVARIQIIASSSHNIRLYQAMFVGILFAGFVLACRRLTKQDGWAADFPGRGPVDCCPLGACPYRELGSSGRRDGA
jgi:hypothetical protein